jgi:PAS domain S-box-containing protein
MKALLVGIDARWEAIVGSVLGIRGHEQLLAADGASALDVVLRDSPALVVVEDALADMSATDFCRKVRACSEGADAVILVITNRDDGLLAVLDAGATDLYATSLGPAALETRLLIAERLVAQQAKLRERERKRAEEALRTSETRYRLLFEQSPLPKFLYDFDSLRFLAVNEAAMRHYGYSHDEFLEMSLLDIRPSEDVPGFLASLDGLEPDATHSSSHRHTKKNGSVIHVDVTVHKFVLGTRPCGLAVAFDMTERNRLEGQLRQAQKMEAVGNLARGIAHDFNNLLSIILGYSNMLGEGLKPGDPLRSDLEEISQAGKRAADLTRQLLVFSCQQILEPRVLDLNVVIGGVVTMLRRLVGEDVELSVVGGAELGAVRADSGQIEQILMNLVANSRDAMPDGGTLTIETANVELDCEFATRHPGVQPGPYVMLAVTDRPPARRRTLARHHEGKNRDAH